MTKKIWPIPIKICKKCCNTFEQPKGVRGKAWRRRLFCSIGCLLADMKRNNPGFKKGHGNFPGAEKGWFKENQTPWNRGRKGREGWHNLSGLHKFQEKYGSANKGKKLSLERREQIRKAMIGQTRPSGQNHWNWHGGTSVLRNAIMQIYLYGEWRKAVYERDDYACQLCRKGGGKLHADHKKAFSAILRENTIKTVAQAKECGELWDVSNGRTLCLRCHFSTDTYGSKAILKPNPIGQSA